MRHPLMKNNIQKQDLDDVISLLQQDDPRLTSGERVKNLSENGLNGWVLDIQSSPMCPQQS